MCIKASSVKIWEFEEEGAHLYLLMANWRIASLFISEPYAFVYSVWSNGVINSSVPSGIFDQRNEQIVSKSCCSTTGPSPLGVPFPP